jgi:mannose-6-phosphate isomerase-like protein (cupin superfamily)
VILEGAGTLVVEADSVPVVAGDVVFVRGSDDRAFVDARDDILALELVVLARPGLDDPSWALFDRDALVEPANPGRNVLNLVFGSQTLHLGAYLLPRELSGDLRVSHGVDEIKVVLSGSASLETESDIQPLGPGSVVYVDGIVPHRFTRLSGDLVVLFVLER